MFSEFPEGGWYPKKWGQTTGVCLCVYNISSLEMQYRNKASEYISTFFSIIYFFILFYAPKYQFWVDIFCVWQAWKYALVNGAQAWIIPVGTKQEAGKIDPNL